MKDNFEGPHQIQNMYLDKVFLEFLLFKKKKNEKIKSKSNSIISGCKNQDG